ncbi:SLC13 family permease [Propionispora hippei]|uniref:Na+/H+ antiporter NhaD n=1 Tax=Propionispora hippei DSM 15287 TaxID=1123003 RepID=A0A1M6DLQ8_9FIRM|nr:SLC13 family permease [Propionispora hippei]SHI74071.1 Na+/H+ antiporter NhaD [Propionispora hippei DSM 15287]
MFLKEGLILAFILVVFSVGKSPFFSIDRIGAAIIASILSINLGNLTFSQALSSIDFRTLTILFFMMIVIANLKVAGFFELLGQCISNKVSTKRQLLLVVIGISGILSAICINDIVCLLLTPIVLLVCRQGECAPLPHLLGLAIASNIGSAATLLGNPQNILIANLSQISFISYFSTAVPIALIGLLICYWLIALFYKKELVGTISFKIENDFHYDRYHICKSLVILLLVVCAYIFGGDLVVSTSLGAMTLLITKKLNPAKIYENIDFGLLLIFAGLFIVVGGLQHNGAVDWAMKNVLTLNVHSFYSLGLITIFLSNLISNVPAVLLLKFFAPAVGVDIWWKSLALFSTFAGNLTLSGSMANLIVAETAKREQINIGFWEFIKIGFPITVLTSCITLIAVSV